MHYISCEYNAQPRWGVQVGDSVHLATADDGLPTTLAGLIELGPAAARAQTAALAADSQRALPLAAVARTAPLPQPRRNVICLGLNYAEHAAESMRAQGREPELPEHPVVFTKAADTVAGSEATIPLDPAITGQLDWEVELGVIVGQRLWKATPQQALAGVFGYCVINDLSARDLQFRHKQFYLGKSLRNACPMGPAIVTPDELANPQALTLTCEVNGVVKQASNTADQIFGIAETLHRLSWITGLQPGDIIATGTPEGVGFARDPAEFLAVGDTVECAIEGLGRLSNPVVGAS